MGVFSNIFTSRRIVATLAIQVPTTLDYDNSVSIIQTGNFEAAHALVAWGFLYETVLFTHRKDSVACELLMGTLHEWAQINFVLSTGLMSVLDSDYSILEDSRILNTNIQNSEIYKIEVSTKGDEPHISARTPYKTDSGRAGFAVIKLADYFMKKDRPGFMSFLPLFIVAMHKYYKSHYYGDLSSLRNSTIFAMGEFGQFSNGRR
jgi:hypothetical protein